MKIFIRNFESKNELEIRNNTRIRNGNKFRLAPIGNKNRSIARNQIRNILSCWKGDNILSSCFYLEHEDHKLGRSVISFLPFLSIGKRRYDPGHRHWRDSFRSFASSFSVAFIAYTLKSRWTASCALKPRRLRRWRWRQQEWRRWRCRFPSLDCRNHAGGTRLFLLGMRLEPMREKRSGREKEMVARGSLTRRWKLASDKIKLPQKARKRRISSLTFSLLSRSCLWHREIINASATTVDFNHHITSAREPRLVQPFDIFDSIYPPICDF